MTATTAQTAGPAPTPAPAEAPEPGRPGRRRRLAVAALALLALAGAGAAAAAWRASRRGPRLLLDTARVDRGRIVAKVTATGTLSAIVTVQVGTQVSGTVASLGADFNSRVRKGQRIAKIDPALFEAAAQQARANLAAARGNLAKARAQAVDGRRQAQRTIALARDHLVAQSDADTAQATADADDAAVVAAEGAVEQARAALHQAEVNLAYTDIVSPTNGIVISRNVDVGQTVAASLQAPTLFVIAEDLAKMQVDTSVAEADVGRLRDGMPAAFTVDAHPADLFRGTVRQIRNAPQTVQNVVTYDAVIDVANPELKLRPGMTANVTFVYAQKEDVVRVPNAALRFRPPPAMLEQSGGTAVRPGRGRAGPPPRGPAQGPGDDGATPRTPADRRPVWVVRGERAEPLEIRTGLSDGSVTEVVEGALAPGDAVVTDAIGGAPAAASGPQGRPPRLF